MTRRQELNRQAQRYAVPQSETGKAQAVSNSIRTHRERKELYIKALEDEVLRLKEIFSHIAQDKERLAEENRQLKAMLAQNGLNASLPSGGVLDDQMSNGYSSSASISGSYVPTSSQTTAFTPPPPLSAGRSPNSATYSYTQSQQQQQQHHSHQHTGQAKLSVGGNPTPLNQNPNIDYEQMGIDFVLR